MSEDILKASINDQITNNEIHRNVSKSNLSFIRKRAFGGGMDVDGQVLYVCRVQMNNQTIPGKFSTKLNKCSVTHKNKEIQYNKYQLLIESKFGSYKWTPMRRPVKKLPTNIVFGGIGHPGQFYYIGQCRVRSREMKRISEQIGKVHFDTSVRQWVATVPFSGHEIMCFDYSVLIMI